MLNSTAFDYVPVLDKAADATRKRENILANNIANVDTVGYKRRDLNFEQVLREELGNSKYVSLDTKVKNADLSKLNPSVYKDYAHYSYRLDGNNVDIDTEEVELASEQIKYEALTKGINYEFTRMKSVIK